MYRIMFIDDEPWVLYGLGDIIDWKELGFDVSGFFSDGEAAWEAICKEQPDVVVTDIRMPELSGMELISRIREKGLAAEVVIISAYRDFEVARDAIRQGVAEYLTKPLKAAEVRAVMERLAGKLAVGAVPQKPALKEPPILPKALWREGADEGEAAWLRKAACYPHCYLLISKEGFGGVIQDLNGSNLRGRLTPVAVAGYQECFLFSALEPLREGLLAGKRSRDHTDFSDCPQMLREAEAALRGDFYYSAQEQISAVQFYLAEHYMQKFSMRELAERFHLSEPYLFELFRKHTGTTVMNFLRDVRLYHALGYLANTGMSIKEIANQVGYEDPGYFSRLFKKQFSISPEACRKNI